jgi:hypothetical protein
MLAWLTPRIGYVCHGPNGNGSSYSPALKTSLTTMNYSDFSNIVVNGRKNVTTSQENVMARPDTIAVGKVEANGKVGIRHGS